MIRVREAPMWAGSGPAMPEQAIASTTSTKVLAGAAVDLVLLTSMSEDVLCHLVNAKDTSELAARTTLEACVDSSQTDCALIGELMPNLTELVLNDSLLSSMRDLGTCLRTLRVLSIARCGLSDLDGCVSSLPALTTLLAPGNMVSDLSALAGHENLEIIDLEGNRISEEDALTGLSLLPSMRSLKLWGNPLVFTLGNRRYRSAVAGLAPSLLLLDDEPCTEDDVDEKGGKGGDDILDSASSVDDPTGRTVSSVTGARTVDSPGSVPHSLRSRPTDVQESRPTTSAGDSFVGGNGDFSVAGAHRRLSIRRPIGGMGRPGAAAIPESPGIGRGQFRPHTALTSSSFGSASIAGSASIYAGSAASGPAAAGAGAGPASGLTHGDEATLMAGSLAASLRRKRTGRGNDSGAATPSLNDTLDSAADSKLDDSFVSSNSIVGELSSVTEPVHASAGGQRPGQATGQAVRRNSSFMVRQDSAGTAASSGSGRGSGGIAAGRSSGAATDLAARAKARAAGQPSSMPSGQGPVVAVGVAGISRPSTASSLSIFSAAQVRGLSRPQTASTSGLPTGPAAVPTSHVTAARRPSARPMSASVSMAMSLSMGRLPSSRVDGEDATPRWGDDDDDEEDNRSDDDPEHTGSIGDDNGLMDDQGSMSSAGSVGVGGISRPGTASRDARRLHGVGSGNGFGGAQRGPSGKRGGMSLMDLLDKARADDERERQKTADELREWRAALKSAGESRDSAIAAGPTADGEGHRPGSSRPGSGQAASGAAVTAPPQSPAVGSGAAAVGEWAEWSDDRLVHVLRQKPKHTPQLHSREAFRRFFYGVPRPRLQWLLIAAYAGTSGDVTPSGSASGPGSMGAVTPEVEDRVVRRMELMDGCFAGEGGTA